jgi:hypothetical protein
MATHIALLDGASDALKASVGALAAGWWSVAASAVASAYSSRLVDDAGAYFTRLVDGGAGAERLLDELRALAYTGAVPGAVPTATTANDVRRNRHRHT